MSGPSGAYRLLVTGSRDWSDGDAVWMALNSVLGQVRETGRTLVVVHGHCPTGADYLAHEWALANNVQVEAHPADWTAHGKAAGPLRNSLMVGLGADLCLAFPEGPSRGTRDCMAKAKAVGIPVQVWAASAPSLPVEP